MARITTDRRDAAIRRERVALTASLVVAAGIALVVWIADPGFEPIPVIAGDPEGAVESAIIPVVVEKETGCGGAPRDRRFPIEATSALDIAEIKLDEDRSHRSDARSPARRSPATTSSPRDLPLEGWHGRRTAGGSPVRSCRITPRMPGNGGSRATSWSRWWSARMAGSRTRRSSGARNSSARRPSRRRSAWSSTPATRNAQPVRVKILRRFTFRLG